MPEPEHATVVGAVIPPLAGLIVVLLAPLVNVSVPAVVFTIFTTVLETLAVTLELAAETTQFNVLPQVFVIASSRFVASWLAVVE